MPPKKRINCKNPIFYEILVSLRDAEDRDLSNMYWVYHKAANGIKGHPEVLVTPEDAAQVKGVGKAMVKALKRGMESRSSSERPSNTDTPVADKKKKAPGRPRKSSSTADASCSVARVASSSSARLPEASMAVDEGVFQFCYLCYDDDESEIRVPSREMAHFEVELDSPGFLIEFRRSCQHPIASQITSKVPQPTRMIGYLPMDIGFQPQFSKSTLPLDWLTRPTIAAAAAPSASSAASLKNASGSGKRSATDDDDDVDILAAENAKIAKRQKKGGGVDPSRQISSASNLSWTVSASGAPVAGKSGSSSGGGLAQRAQTMPLMSPPSPPRPIASSSQASIRRTDSAPVGTQRNRNQTQATRPRLSHVIPPPVEMDIDIEDPYASTDHVVFPDFTPLVISNHQYDVVLVLDNREIKSGVDRSGIYDGLRRKNIRVEQRSLNLGDVCWIAKRKPEHCDGGEYDEIALDCILERKRLDDLQLSIKHGRFHEQKFRLHNTAITKVYYLVEEYKMKGLGISEEEDKSRFDKAIETSKSQTKIIDKFLVKETRSVNDTISFYARLHQNVVSSYQGQNLYIIPSQFVKRYSYLKFQKELRSKYPTRSHLISFPIFDFLNSKSGFTTVRETWARMLLCIKGVSAEKAGVLIQHFPTPESLYEACKRAEKQQKDDDEDERIRLVRGGKPRAKKDVFIAEEFLQDFGGNTERKIGKALSRKIFNVIMQVEYSSGDDN